jgi:Domain of unknown function (DUF4258)
VTLDLQKIRAAAHADRIRWRYHALSRAAERGIARELALRVVHEGEILEKHPYAKPFPKCLMMMTIEPDRPLYVALAYDKGEDYLYIITVHWLDPSKWEDPWTRRSRRVSQRRTNEP